MGDYPEAADRETVLLPRCFRVSELAAIPSWSLVRKVEKSGELGTGRDSKGGTVNGREASRRALLGWRVNGQIVR